MTRANHVLAFLIGLFQAIAGNLYFLAMRIFDHFSDDLFSREFPMTRLNLS